MTTNIEIEGRRDRAVAKAIAYSSTFVAEKAENAEIWAVSYTHLTLPTNREV